MNQTSKKIEQKKNPLSAFWSFISHSKCTLGQSKNFLFFFLQFVAFVLHTIVRTFLHSSTGALYACMFHFSHFGKLTGLTSFLGAVAILVQDPLFVLINDQLNGNPFWVSYPSG